MAEQTPVLLVGNFLSQSVGTRGVCEELAVRLAAAGRKVLTTSDRPGRASRLADMVHCAWSKRREYGVAQVDVFSGPAFFWAEAACWTLRRAGKPYVLTLHGGNLPGFSRGRAARARRLLRSAAVVTTPSRYLLEGMRPHREDLRLLPNALDLNAYPFRLRAAPRPRLVWLRAFHEIYNPTLAPEVVRLLAEAHPEVRLTMVGPDKGDGSLQRTRARAEALGVAERIAFPGAVPKAEVPRWMGEGDIFLNTTNVDNTPVSVLEAMASGACVVSTDVGGLPYLLDGERDALLVPPGDAQAMAAAVRRVLAEPGLAERLSRGGRAKTEGVDWAVVLPQWEALLDTVAEGGKR
jgi:glycosyltransferase involved in cell wall biosynthesis